MGIFGKKKEARAPKPQEPTVTAPSINVVDKKEPLLSKEKKVDNASGNVYDPEEGDADITVSSSYRRDLDGEEISETYPGEIETKIPAMKQKKALSMFACCSTTIPKPFLYAGIGIVAAGAIVWGLMGGGNKEYRVAFVGNSYFYVNDLPRFVETIAGGKIFQDSCLHGTGSILNLLKTGNGMYDKWQTQNGMLGGIEWTQEDGNMAYLYDYGACSVPQLLTGHDNMLSYENYYGSYINDGSNPCLVDYNYMEYESSFNYTQSWDFVVITDQSKRMCFDDARYEALMAFNYTYGPVLKKIGATPVLVQPHGFWSKNANMTGLENVADFTSKIMEGAKIYKDFLDEQLPWSQRAKIARVGDAYLTVYEEDEEMWDKLFLSDFIHPSGYGTYLYGTVIYATIYGHMPKKGDVVIDEVMDLFATSRRLHAGNSTYMPTKDEALYLYKVAKRVALLGHTPTSYRAISNSQADEMADEIEDEYDEEDVDDAVAQGDDYYSYGDDQYYVDADDANQDQN